MCVCVCGLAYLRPVQSRKLQLRAMRGHAWLGKGRPALRRHLTATTHIHNLSNPHRRGPPKAATTTTTTQQQQQTHYVFVKLEKQRWHKIRKNRLRSRSLTLTVSLSRPFFTFVSSLTEINQKGTPRERFKKKKTKPKPRQNKKTRQKVTYNNQNRDWKRGCEELSTLCEYDYGWRWSALTDPQIKVPHNLMFFFNCVSF